MDQSAGVNKEEVRAVSVGKKKCPSHSKKHKNRRLVLKKKKKQNFHHRKAVLPPKRDTHRPPPVLRPAGSQVPRAPENSTQFIMDNHENSNLFYNFDSNQDAYNDYKTAADVSAGNDFENAYRSAHEENLLVSNTDHLKSAIVSLESKCVKLKSIIAARPSVLLDHLQSVLINLQEENKRLRENSKKKRSRNSGSSSDTDSSNSSDSDSSSCTESECSLSDCADCLDKEENPSSERSTSNIEARMGEQ